MEIAHKQSPYLSLAARYTVRTEYIRRTRRYPMPPRQAAVDRRQATAENGQGFTASNMRHTTTVLTLYASIAWQHLACARCLL